MSDWQPIETAPRDGSAILCHLPNAGPFVARQDIDIVHYSGWGGGVWEGSRGYAKYRPDEPTHWMPLPDAP
jgi:hypothetical protein